MARCGARALATWGIALVFLLFVLSDVRGLPFQGHNGYYENLQQQQQQLKEERGGYFDEKADVAPRCDSVDLRDHAVELLVLNGAMDAVHKTGYLRKKLMAFDPVVVHDVEIEPAMPVSLVGVHFRVTTVLVRAMQVAGVATAAPRHVNVTSSTNVMLGADFGGELHVNGSVRVTIEQEQRKWWQLCWTHPVSSLSKHCKPLDLELDVRVAWRNPSFVTDAHLEMLRCPHHRDDGSGADATTGMCSDLSMGDVIAAILRGRVKELETRVLRRVRQFSIANVTFAFNELSQLKLVVHRSSAFARMVADKVAQLSRQQVNHRGWSYRALTKASERMMNASMNAVIECHVARSFGGTCFDPEIQSDKCRRDG